jgi:hypothetical protein
MTVRGPLLVFVETENDAGLSALSSAEIKVTNALARLREKKKLHFN